MAARRAALALALAAPLLATNAKSQTEKVKTEDMWTYSDQKAWSYIPGSSCDSDQQSPIDIDTSSAALAPSTPLVTAPGGSMRLGHVEWRYAWPMVNVSLSANRRGWQARLLPPYDETTRITFFGKDFALKRLRLASPSENKVDGRSYDVEVQHVHEASDGRLLVVSVMLQVGLVPDDLFLEQFWHDFPAPSAAPVDKIIANPYYGGFPADKSFFAFNGSLTEPPCKGDVVWMVFRDAVLISRQQRDLYRAAMAGQSYHYLRMAQESPTGVVEPWDLSIGMNNRLSQSKGSRQVVLFGMQVKAPEKPAASSDTWAYVVLGLLGASLLVGVGAVIWVLQHQKGRRRTRGHERQELMLESASEADSPKSSRSSDRSALPQLSMAAPPQPWPSPLPQGVMMPQRAMTRQLVQAAPMYTVPTNFVKLPMTGFTGH